MEEDYPHFFLGLILPNFGTKQFSYAEKDQMDILSHKSLIFNEGNYKTAFAFLQMDGDNNLHIDFEMASNCLTKAAEIYEEIGKQALAASCFMKWRNYSKAADIYLENFPEPRYEDAGDCYALAGLWSDTAKLYAQGSFKIFYLLAEKDICFELSWMLLKIFPENGGTDTKKLGLLSEWISQINKDADIQSSIEYSRFFPEDAYSFLLGKGKYVNATGLQRMKGNTLSRFKHVWISLSNNELNCRERGKGQFILIVDEKDIVLMKGPESLGSWQANLLKSRSKILKVTERNMNEIIRTSNGDGKQVEDDDLLWWVLKALKKKLEIKVHKIRRIDLSPSITILFRSGQARGIHEETHLEFQVRWEVGVPAVSLYRIYSENGNRT